MINTLYIAQWTETDKCIVKILDKVRVEQAYLEFAVDNYLVEVFDFYGKDKINEVIGDVRCLSPRSIIKKYNV